MDKLLTVNEVSEYLHLRINTIYDYAKKGKIPCTRPFGKYLFRKEDIDEWLDKTSNKSFLLTEIPPKSKFLDNALADYDKVYLKGDSAVVNKKQRWRYEDGIVYLRKNPGGSESWGIEYKDEKGKRKQRIVPHARSRWDAVIALNETVKKINCSTSNDTPWKRRMTFNEVADKFITEYVKRIRDKVTYRSCMKYTMIYFSREYGSMFIDEVTPQKIRNLMDWLLERERTNATCNRYRAVLSRMFTWAIDERFVGENPVGKVERLPEEPRTRTVDKDEEPRFLAKAKEHIVAFYLIKMNTGLRKSDVLNLRWQDVNFAEKTITTIVSKTGDEIVIPVNRHLLAELSRLKKGKRDSIYLDPKNEYIFFNPKTQKPLKEIRKSFKTACRKAGIEDLRPHDLRRTVGSRMNAKGVTLPTASKSLGHRTTEVTAKHYIQLDIEQIRRAFDSLVDEPCKRQEQSDELLHACDIPPKKENRKLLSYYFSMN